MNDYRKRIIDDELGLRLEAFGAVHIKGPKWCGKRLRQWNMPKVTLNSRIQTDVRDT